VASPEERQTRLLEMYREAHRRGGWFHGTAIRGHIEDIGRVIQETGSKTLLDYGCGKAVYYVQNKVHHQWGVTPTFYEPGIEKWAKKPEGKFDGVVCTDVLEHVLEPEKVLKEVIGYAEKFCYLAISCQHSPPTKKLPDGTALHISVHPPSWWRERIEPYKHIRIEVRFDVEEPSASETLSSGRGSQEKQG
jgi:hypothetical protein